jgi:parvulin-like peptidyl-prolyl isomerase
MRNDMTRRLLLKNSRSLARLAVLFLLLAVAENLATAEIIDRVIAVVDAKIITTSDVRQERNLRNALGEAPTPDGVILQQLIEELLVEDQMLQFPGVEINTEQVDAEFNKVLDRRNLSPEVIRNGIRRRLARIQFFDLRFRQFIAASDEEIQQYYTTVFVPEAQRRGVSNIPVLAEVIEMVRENVINEKMSREVDIWLDAVRGRSTVEVFE